LRPKEVAISLFEAGGGCRWLNNGGKQQINNGVMIFVFFQQQTRERRLWGYKREEGKRE
jgi:hypothetical protein